MSAEENMRIVRRIFHEVFDNRNVHVIDELYATNFVYHAPGNPDLDRDGLMASFVEYLTAFSEIRMVIEDMFGAGDKVATRFTCCGAQQGEFMGVPPSGKQVTLTAILIQHLAAGKVVEDWEWSDSLGVMQQLGLFSLPQ